MRAIDADALIEQIKAMYCDGCDNYGGARCRGCLTNDAIAQVDDAPTVDAIPVEWLTERHRKACEEADTEMMDAITRLVNEYYLAERKGAQTNG